MPHFDDTNKYCHNVVIYVTGPDCKKICKDMAEPLIDEEYSKQKLYIAKGDK